MITFPGMNDTIYHDASSAIRTISPDGFTVVSPGATIHAMDGNGHVTHVVRKDGDGWRIDEVPRHLTA